MGNGRCRLLVGLLLGLLLVPVQVTPAAACRCGVVTGIEIAAVGSSGPDNTGDDSLDTGAPRSESDAEWARWVLGIGLAALLGVTSTIGWRRWRAPE